LTAKNEERFAFYDTGPSLIVKHACQALAIDEHRDQFVPTLWTGTPPESMEIEQVWFVGAHSDVGGGYITRALADIPLVWMARKSEMDGLSLDWSCLPDPAKLDPLAPLHDSREGIFRVDRLTPTFRQIAKMPCAVSFYETLYAPSLNGVQLPTINQAIHSSVVKRYGQKTTLCTDDHTGECEDQVYEARNLAPFFDTKKNYVDKPPVVD
jgi:hypothetical protein